MERFGYQSQDTATSADGLYKVGVYCGNPPHWQGSGWLNFEVTSRSDLKKDGTEEQPFMDNTQTKHKTRTYKSDTKPFRPKTAAPTEGDGLMSRDLKRNIGIGMGVIALITLLIVIARKKSG